MYATNRQDLIGPERFIDPEYLRQAARDRREQKPKSVVAQTYEAVAAEIERLRLLVKEEEDAA